MRLALLGVLVPAGLALRAQEKPASGDLDRLIEDAKRALAAKQAGKPKALAFEQHLYDLRDLTTPVRDHPARSLNLVPSGGFGFGFGEEYAEEPLAFYEGDTIADMIREYVQPDSWDELRSASIEYRNGILVVTHTARVHEEIAAFLAELRSRAASQLTIDVRGIRLSGADLDAVLGDASALVVSEDGERRLAKLLEEGRATVLFAGAVQCVNTQRVNLTELTRRSYVQDYDVEIAEASSIADPIVQVLEEGVVVDVRPFLAGNGELAILEVRADLAHLDGMGEIETPVGNIELPKLSILRIRTTLATAIGRSVVIGGTVADGDEGAMLIVLTPTAYRPGSK